MSRIYPPFLLLVTVVIVASPGLWACCDPPVCGFTVNQPLVGLGDRTSFNACYPQSYDPDGGLIDYLWSFGSGATGISGQSGCSPSCKYTTPGYKTVSLRVRDHDGTDCFPCLFDCVNHLSGLVEHWVIVSSVVKITKSNSTDEGPLYSCVGIPISLFADSDGNPYPPNKPVWSVVSQPQGGAATINPPQGYATVTVDNLTVPGVYTIKAKCGADDPGDTISITVIGIASLLPDQGVEFDDGDNDPDTRAYALGVATSGVVTVTATPTPAVSESLLPPCWGLGGGNGTGKLVQTVSKTTPSLTSITCSCGNTSKTVKMYIVELRLCPIGGGPNSCNFIFDSNHPGVCLVKAEGSTGIQALDYTLEWTLSEVAGSLQTCSPENQTGYYVEFSYTGLPPWNSSFGQKTLTFTHPLLPDGLNSKSQTVEIYYSFGAKNWPGAGPEPHPKPLDPDNPPPPNWLFARRNYFYYYSQTNAFISGCIYHYNGSSCTADDIPSYRAFVGCIDNPYPVGPYEYLGFPIVNNSDELFGIDCFAYACRHEWKHHLDYTSWWGPSGVDPTLDHDGDNMLDSVEPGYPPNQGGEYWTFTPTTHSDYTGGLDDQAECVFTQTYWPPLSLIYQDWAFPGSKWNNKWYKP